MKILTTIDVANETGVTETQQDTLLRLISEMRISAPARPSASGMSTGGVSTMTAGGTLKPPICGYKQANGKLCPNPTIEGTVIANRCGKHTSSGYSAASALALAEEQYKADDEADTQSGLAALMAARAQDRRASSASYRATSSAGCGATSSGGYRERVEVATTYTGVDGACGAILKTGLRTGLGCLRTGISEYDGRCKQHRS